MASSSQSLEAPSQGRRRKLDNIRSLISPGTFAIIAGSAFTMGLTGALIIALRRGRARDAAEAVELAAASGLSATPNQATAALPPRAGLVPLQAAHSCSPNEPPASAPLDSVLQAADAGPLSLFLSMNKAAFSRKSKGAPQTSMFDATSDAPPPSVLMKSSKARGRVPAACASGSAAEHGVGAMLRARREQMERANGAFPKEDQGSPVLLTIKAFGMATAIVGVTALATLEVGRRLFGVRDIDDFTTLMAKAFPQGSNASILAERLGTRARRRASEANGSDASGAAEQRTDHVSERQSEVRSALEKIEDWIRLVGEEIAAENEKEELERQKVSEEEKLKRDLRLSG